MGSDMGLIRNKDVSCVIPHLSCTGQFVNVCFDIGGVLLKPNLDVSHGTALHPTVFKRMMRSHTWHQYQEGKLTWTQTRQELAHDAMISETDIQSFVDKARASLAPVDELVALIEPLQRQCVKLYCMTNAAQGDLDAMLTAFPELFQSFDAIFCSGAAGIRKPGFGAFHHFLHETNCQASRTLFVDDELQNVVAAEVLGFTTVLVEEDPTSAVDLLVYNLRTEEERLAAAYDFLHKNKGQPIVTSEGVRVHILYDEFLIAELLNDPSYLPVHEAPETGRFNFLPAPERRREFHETKNARSHRNFPDDLDTTSLALSIMHGFGKVDMGKIHRVLDSMLEYRNEDGLFQVYLNPFRRRMDHVIHVVVCTLFVLADRVEPIKQAMNYIIRMLKTRAYLRGSLYYPCPETFLWHVARMKRAAAKSTPLEPAKVPLEPEMVRLLEKRLRERLGVPANAVALAQRVLACQECGVPCGRDRKQLARMQKVDGSWGTCSFYSYSDHETWFANDVTAVAFAVAALHGKGGSK